MQDATAEDGLRVTEKVCELVEGDEPFAISTVVGGSGPAGRAVIVTREGILAGSTQDRTLDREMAREASWRTANRQEGRHQVATAEVFTEILMPPPRLIVFGANDDAIPICAYAADVGFRVTVVDHRPVLLQAERFPSAAARVALRAEEDSAVLPLGPRSYAVVKMHSFAQDREWVKKLLDAGVPYVGLLGPRARTQEILSQIRAEASDRVYGPVGLDLGAEGPEQVALGRSSRSCSPCIPRREPAHLRQKGSRDPCNLSAAARSRGSSWPPALRPGWVRNKLLLAARSGDRCSGRARSPRLVASGLDPGPGRPRARGRPRAAGAHGARLPTGSPIPTTRAEVAISSVRAGIAAVPAGTLAAVVLLADMPFVTEAMLSTLIAVPPTVFGDPCSPTTTVFRRRRRCTTTASLRNCSTGRRMDAASAW